MTGFGDFVEEVAESRNRHDLRARVPIAETASMWQSLAYKPNYKAAYCIAVCPAGEDVMAPFLADRRGYLEGVMKPLTERTEPIYVVAGSDAEAHEPNAFPTSGDASCARVCDLPTRAPFFQAIPLTFQRGPARGWSAAYHFDLSGPRSVQATVRIADGTLEILPGLVGTADVTVRASGEVWLDVVTKKRSAVLAVLTGRMKVRGPRNLLTRFAACFPR